MSTYLDLLRQKANASFANPCHSPDTGKFCETAGITDRVKKLNLPEGKYAVAGSAWWDIKGIRHSKDLDIVVTPEVYEELQKREGWQTDIHPAREGHKDFESLSYDSDETGPVQVIRSDRATETAGITPDLNAWISQAEKVDGVPIVKLEELYKLKKAYNRPKDQQDIAAMDKVLTASAELSTSVETEIVAAGIAVQAEDTGRLLLLQRALSDEDPAAGKWEFPGGTLDPGETPIDAAVREWQEETGHKLPADGEWAGQWESGVYKGFIYRVPSETSVEINLDHEDRHALNPDDPDGDNIEVIAWWSPNDLQQNPAVREELQDTDWLIFRTKASLTERVAATLADFSLSEVELYNKCHDEETGEFCEDPFTHKQVRIEKATKEEHQAAKAKAKAWVRIAPVPTPAEVKRNRAQMQVARTQGKSVHDVGGGRTNSEGREKQRQNIFQEFGGTKKGYVIDARSGIKMHWTDDPTINPNQYPVFTLGRIFNQQQGGSYTLDNLLPESFPSNRSRGSRPIRKENLT